MANAVMENTPGPTGWKVPAPRPAPVGEGWSWCDAVVRPGTAVREPAGWTVPAPRPEPADDEWIWEDTAEEPEPVVPGPSVREQPVDDPARPAPAAPEPAVPTRADAEPAAPDLAGPEPAGPEPVVPAQAEPVDEPARAPGPRHARRCGFTLAALPSAPRWARALVRDALVRWGMDSYAHTAELLVSELVTNAVNAGGRETVVRMTAEVDRLRIEVADCGAGSPRVAEPAPDAEAGHGLLVVATLSAEWGSYPVRLESGATIGKVVWCEIPATEPEAAPGAAHA